MSESNPRQMHESAGVEAGGVVDSDGRVVPVVTLSFLKDSSALEDLNKGIYDPDDGRWHNFTMTVRAARNVIEELRECVDIAIAGSSGGDA